MERRHPLDVNPLHSESKYRKSKHEVFPALMKAIYVSPTAGGKTSSAITAIMAQWNLYTRVVLFSPTCDIDPSFEKLKEDIKKKLISKGIDPDDPEEEVGFESLDQLPRVVQKQTQLIKQERDLGRGKLSALCILCDDNLGNMRFNKHLDALASRGRHLAVHLHICTQVYRGLSSQIRKNVDCLAIFRLPAMEYQAVAEEVVGSHVSKEQFEELYKRAVSSPHQFLWILLKSPDPEHMFYRGFSTRLVPT